jgi:hypothetical protein
LATYPSNPNLPQGTNETAVNPANWNTLVDNINAIGADLVDARGDGQEFPGTDHTAGQATDTDDILQAVKHMLADISGETNWYSEPAANLKLHDHSSGKGGSIPWSSIASNTRFRELHPEYPGAVWTTSLRGASPSGSNMVDRSAGQDVVSYVARNYYEATSSETSLQDYYVALRFTLPEDFNAWALSNAIQVEYRTESGTSINCHVDFYIYKSGTASLVTSSENNASTAWSTIAIDDSALGSWSAGDIVEIYLKLETRSDYYARVGKVRFNYTS